MGMFLANPIGKQLSMNILTFLQCQVFLSKGQWQTWLKDNGRAKCLGSQRWYSAPEGFRDLSVIEPITDMVGYWPASALQEKDLYTFQSNNVSFTQGKTGTFFQQPKRLRDTKFQGPSVVQLCYTCRVTLVSHHIVPW